MASTNTGTFTKLNEELKTTVEKWTYSGHSNWYHTWQLVATLKSIDEINMTATVSLKGTLRTQYLTWQYTQKSFGIYANGETVKELHLERNVLHGTTGTEKELYSVSGDVTLPYNNDGTLSAAFEGKIFSETGTNAPKNTTHTISAKFPTITTANAYIKNNGEIKLAQAHILKDGQFVSCDVYRKQNGEMVKINYNKANLAE